MNAENESPAPGSLDGPTSGANAIAWFDEAARREDPFKFEPDDVGRLELLRQRLGSVAGMSIVEPGCGAGHLTEWLGRWCSPDGKVTAFDPSETMIERARQRVAGAAPVELVVGSIESITLPAAVWDCVVCFRVWPHFADATVAAAACVRWLKPGGRLLIVHWKGRRRLDALHGSVEAMARSVFPEPEAWQRLLRDAGFAIRTWIDEEHEIFIDCVRTA